MEALYLNAQCAQGSYQVGGFITPRKFLGHRNDVHFDGGLFATWDISRSFALRSEATWTFDESNRSEEDYEVFEPQLSIYAEVGF
jgi:hypothetical protein